MPRRRSAAADTEALVNLNARIPRRLYERLPLCAVEKERLIRDIVTEALRERLATKRCAHL